MQDRWLKCQVGPGMFSNEYTVTVVPAGASTDAASHFVSDGYVTPGSGGGHGRVRVRAWQSGSTWWAILPTESQDVIAVSAADLQPA